MKSFGGGHFTLHDGAGNSAPLAFLVPYRRPSCRPFLLPRDRWFESMSLQERVAYELEFRSRPGVRRPMLTWVTTRQKSRDHTGAREVLMQLPKKLTASGNVLVLLSLMYFITYVDRVNISTAAPAIKGEFGLSNTELGLIFSAFAYPYALFQVFGGWLGDKWGARLTLFLCGTIWAAATILTGLASGLVSLFGIRVLLGFGEGATFPTATRAMQNWVARDRRGFAQGFVHSAARLGNAITPPVVAALIALVTWRGSFVLLGLVSLLWVLVWVWYFRDDPRRHRGVTEAELARLPVQDAAETRPRVPWGRLTLRILPVTITYFCYGWSFWLFITWLPSFFKDHYNLDLKNAALFSSAVFFAGVVGDTSGGMTSDAILRRTAILSRHVAMLSSAR
jgi:sugar phosphate permease